MRVINGCPNSSRKKPYKANLQEKQQIVKKAKMQASLADLYPKDWTKIN